MLPVFTIDIFRFVTSHGVLGIANGSKADLQLDSLEPFNRQRRETAEEMETESDKESE